MTDLRPHKLYEKGKREALDGKLDAAIPLFEQASETAFHIQTKNQRLKLVLEILTMLHLCEAILLKNKGDLIKSKYKYIKFQEFQNDYEQICNTTSDVNAKRRYDVWFKEIKDLFTFYKYQINL